MLTNILLQILRGVWMMEADSARALAPTVQALLSRESVNLEELNKKYESQFDALFSNFKCQSVIAPSYVGGGKYGFNAVNNGSIAVIPLQGVVIKNDYCGALGTKTITDLFMQAQKSPNIKGIILYTDSPGGAALGTNEAASIIYSLNKGKNAKPSVTYVENMMCSAAMWIGSSTRHIIANKQDFAMIGSIGTYITLSGKGPNDAPTIEIYATDSTQKNIESREALNGNTQPMLDNIINPLNDSFKAGMTRNRYGLLNKEKVFTGATFQAKDALKYGLVDAIGTFEDAINYININAKN